MRWMHSHKPVLDTVNPPGLTLHESVSGLRCELEVHDGGAIWGRPRLVGCLLSRLWNGSLCPRCCVSLLSLLYASTRVLVEQELEELEELEELVQQEKLFRFEVVLVGPSNAGKSALSGDPYDRTDPTSW